MTELAPGVALLFDDVELGTQLRDALHERGARMVYEGKIATLSKQLLADIAADVVVINLDESAADALDNLYEVIDSDRPRVVFNDAQASRALTGWDRARWARHLAAKVLEVSDVDPPRPAGVPAIEVSVAAVAQPIMTAAVEAAEPPIAAPDALALLEPSSEGLQPAAPEVAAVTPFENGLDLDFEAQILAAGKSVSDDAPLVSTNGTESEDLAAELEALLASTEAGAVDADTGEANAVADEADADGDETVTDEAVTDQAVTGTFEADEVAKPAIADEEEFAFATDEAPPPPWYDDDLGADALAFGAASATEFGDARSLPTGGAFPPPLPDVTATAASIADEIPVSPFAELAGASESWSLVDDDAKLPTAEQPDAAVFGLEKLSAADYLAPDVEQAAPSTEPFMSLQLVSMEEAVAPQAFVHDHEMLLDDLSGALSRIVALGAVDRGIDSVCEFLAALPTTSRLAFLYTQHGVSQSVEAIVQRLAAHSALPVHQAALGQRVGAGEVWVMPIDQLVHVRRDGSIRQEGTADDEEVAPSIDSSFTMAAHVFGRDAVAIVFAGQATDAVAGAQAIHDRGGQVWVEASSGEYLADMVSGIFAERLVSFSGTPRDLAAHLIEVFP
ncbi:MAG: chemotaxis protein CheB [Rhodanobacter sp.]